MRSVAGDPHAGSPPPFLDRWAEVDGLTIYARVAEHTDARGMLPLVLIHGLSMASNYMMPAARELSMHHPVYVPDLPGFGRSCKPAHTCTLAELADTLAAWMDAVELARAAFLGNSFGCQVILELALRYPNRTDRAVLVGPTVDPRGRTAYQQILRTLCTGLFYEPPSLIPIVLYNYAIAGPRRTIETLRYLLADPVEQKLAGIKIPTLVVRGALDLIVPQRWVEEMVRTLPHGTLAVVPNAAHTVNYHAPAELAHLVHPFLRSSL